LIDIISIIIILLVTSGVVFIIRRFFAFYRLQKELKATFSKKVSPAVMKNMLKEPKIDFLDSRELDITILFSDIRGFTTISETIANPDCVISLLNHYFTPMVDSIISKDGTVDKFIGDAIMAFWNAPTPHQYHPDEAVSSALQQVEALDEINNWLKLQDQTLYNQILEAINQDIADPKARYFQAINIGVGINSGVAMIGEIGSSGKADYTAIGDSVNLASRLEGLCKVYGVAIIISEQTKNRLTKDFKLRELDRVRVKGKNKDLRIYEVLHFNIDDWELKCYYKALNLYRKGRFQNAYLYFRKLTQKGTKESYRLYKMYQQRCAKFKLNPPKNWDGIFIFKRKY